MEGALDDGYTFAGARIESYERTLSAASRGHHRLMSGTAVCASILAATLPENGPLQVCHLRRRIPRSPGRKLYLLPSGVTISGRASPALGSASSAGRGCSAYRASAPSPRSRGTSNIAHRTSHIPCPARLSSPSSAARRVSPARPTSRPPRLPTSSLKSPRQRESHGVASYASPAPARRARQSPRARRHSRPVDRAS